jgi:hypothetical protein
MMKTFATWALCLSSVIGAPTREKRQDLAPPDLTVDLDYAVYTGYSDSASGLNVWKGYAELFFQHWHQLSHTNHPFISIR